MLILVSSPCYIYAQTDSLSVSPPDTTRLTSPLDSLIRGVGADSASAVFSLGDSSNKEKPTFVNRIRQSIKKQLPEVYEVNDEIKLRIKLPWRDDIQIPYLKGLTKVGSPPPYDPKVAWQRSALIPGWGQAYNRSYWKIPFFYVGYAAAAWWYNYNHQQYVRFGNAYFWTIDGNPNTSDPDLLAEYDDTRLRQLRDEFRQQRDRAVLIFLGWHVIQIAEAYVNAHLKGFDVSEDLSIRTSPGVIQVAGMGGDISSGPALSLTFIFRNC